MLVVANLVIYNRLQDELVLAMGGVHTRSQRGGYHEASKPVDLFEMQFRDALLLSGGRFDLVAPLPLRWSITLVVRVEQLLMPVTPQVNARFGDEQQFRELRMKILQVRELEGFPPFRVCPAAFCIPGLLLAPSLRTVVDQ